MLFRSQPILSRLLQNAVRQSRHQVQLSGSQLRIVRRRVASRYESQLLRPYIGRVIVGDAALQPGQRRRALRRCVRAVGHRPRSPAPPQVLPQRHGVRPRAHLSQKPGRAAVQCHRQRPRVHSGNRQRAYIPCLLYRPISGHRGEQLPVGQRVGGVRQPLPGCDKIRRCHRLPVGPAGPLPQSEGIGGVPRVIGVHGPCFRLSGGQLPPAGAVVLPAQQVLVEVIDHRLLLRLGGVQRLHTARQAHPQGVRARLLLGRGAAAGRQQQNCQQRREQRPARQIPLTSHLREPGCRRGRI